MSDGVIPAGNEALWSDFKRFARAQIASDDLDPTYPLLRAFYNMERIPQETALWRTFLYVAFYHLGSAETAWRHFPQVTPVSGLAGLPTGIERRGFRGVTSPVERHINDFVEVVRFAGGIDAWLRVFVGDDREASWDRVRRAFQSIKGNGPWASYKWADLLAHVHGYPITASDLGVGGASPTAGPIPGMVRLTGRPWKLCASDRPLQRALLAKAVAEGVPFSGLDQLETALCDFNSLAKGGYYLGHDVDSQQEALAAVRSPALWEARATFHDRFRGELNGWSGVRKHLKGLYRDKGELYLP